MNGGLSTLLQDHPLIEAVGWTLVHFLWQGVLVGLGVALCRGAIPPRAAQWRYAVSCAGLVLLTVLPLVTVVYQWDQCSNRQARWQTMAMAGTEAYGRSTERTLPSSEAPNASGMPLRSNRSTEGDSSLHPAEGETSELRSTRSSRGLVWKRIDTLLPTVVIGWVLGVGGFGLRLAMGLRQVRRWYHQAIPLKCGSVQAGFSRLTTRMNLARPVRLLETAAVTVPAVIGWLRPVVLLPTSMISGLTPQELEAVLAHELAHIRRHDYAVNFLQSLIEAVLFYHPVVWWVSRAVRTDREHCCDDVATAICGDGRVLASALARMEEIRCLEERVLLAATGGSLVRRIRRLINNQPSTSSWWPAGMVVLASLLLLLSSLSVSWVIAAPGNRANSNPQDGASRASTDALITETTPSQVPTSKSEFTKRDSRTGLEKRVFGDIILHAETPNSARSVRLEMVYSNVLPYSLIPARVARELGAPVLGEIDFGERPPNRPAAFQTIVSANELTGDSAAEGRDRTDEDPGVEQRVTVSELKAPVQGALIVPDSKTEVWVPGHLGTYGMNQQEQRKFKIVRLSGVELGIGPAFGPINALVLDDENSEFGVLGRDWLRQPRGANGESLWFTPEGALHFVAAGEVQTAANAQDDSPAAAVADVPAPGVPPVRPPSGAVSVESRPRATLSPRVARPDIKVIAAHNYLSGSRTSTGWVNVDGVNVPVDVGLEHQGIVVSLSLFFDVLAVSRQTKEVVWKVDWTKSEPIWQWVSLVELPIEDEVVSAVELFAADERKQTLTYRYFSLQDGQEIPFTVVNREQAASAASRGQAQLQVLESNQEGVVRAVWPAPRTAAADLNPKPGTTDSTENETEPEDGLNDVGSLTLVAALPRYVLGDKLEADRVEFLLPRDSGVRVEFRGKDVEVSVTEKGTEIIVTEGTVRLLDDQGVVRATASPDGGAEQLWVRELPTEGEVALSIQSKRLVPDEVYPDPPLHVSLNLAEPKRELRKRGAARYWISPPGDSGDKLVRLKFERVESGAGGRAPEPNPQAAVGPPSASDPAVAEGEATADRLAQAGWGPKPARGDLRMRLTLLGEEWQEGESVKAKLEIRNFGDQPAEYDPQFYAPFRVIKVEREKGDSDLFIGSTPQTSGSAIELKPGESRVVWNDVDLAQLYLLGRGSYRVHVTEPRFGGGALPKSNVASLVIAPGELPALKRLAQSLIPIIPDGWDVSLAQGALFVSHSPTRLKKDITTIQLWFTAEDLPADFVLGEGELRQIVTTLGPSQLGFVNLAAPGRAKQLWPDYVEAIGNAVRQSLENRGPVKPAGK